MLYLLLYILKTIELCIIYLPNFILSSDIELYKQIMQYFCDF